MHDMYHFENDDKLWQIIGLCSLNGVTTLVIGSGSGVFHMVIKNIDFSRYMNKVSVGADVGDFSIFCPYLIQDEVLYGDNIALPKSPAIEVM